MSSIKPEVVEFKKLISDSIKDEASDEKKSEAFIESMTMIFSTLTDIRDLLIK